MANEDGVNIPINSSFNPAGTDAAAAQFQALGARLRELENQEAKTAAPIKPTVALQGREQVQGKLRDLTKDADEFIHALKLGVGIDIGGRIVEGLAEIAAKFKEAIAEGVEYDKKIETLGLGLAAALRQTQPETYGGFNDALKTSGDLLDIVKQKALELNVSTEGLAHTLQVSMVGLVEGGIKDLNQQVEVTGLLMQAAAAKGLTGFTALRDVIAILSGRANRVQLGRELGITDKEVERAKETGQLAEYLTGKLGAYREAAAAVGDSLGGLQRRFENLTNALKGEVSAPVFDAIKDAYRELDEELANPEVADALRAIGFEIGIVVRTGAGLLNFAVQNAGAMRLLAEGTVAFGAAVAAVKIKDLVVGLGAKVLGLRASTAATLQDAEAEGVNKVATDADTASKLRNAEASRVQAAANSQAAAAAGKGAGATAVVSGLGIGGALNVGLLAGVALNLIITEIAANIDAATTKSNALGAAFEKSSKAAIDLVQHAHSAAEQESARLTIQQQIVDLTLRLAHARGEERQFVQQDLAIQQALLAHFHEQAGTANERTEAAKKTVAEEGKLQKIQETIAKTQKDIAEVEKQKATRGPQQQAQRDQLAALHENLAALQQSEALQQALVKSAKDRAVAHKEDSEALKEIGAMLNQQNLDDSSKAAQAKAYKDALTEQIRQAAEYTGLQQDVIANIRTAADLESEEVRNLSQEKKTALAGYLEGIIAARNASDKANDALQKEQDQQTKAAKELAQTTKEQADKKAELQRITDYLASAEGKQMAASKEGQSACNKLRQDAVKLTEEIAAAEGKLEDQRAKAFPKETQRLKEIERLLKGTPVTGEPDAADERQRLIKERQCLQDTVSGKPPVVELSDEAIARIMGYTDANGQGRPDQVPSALSGKPAANPYNFPATLSETLQMLIQQGVKTQSPLAGAPVSGQGNALADFIFDAILKQTPHRQAQEGSDFLRDTATTRPFPETDPTQGDGAMSDFVKSASDLSDTAQNTDEVAGKLSEASGKLSEAAGKLPGDFAQVTQSFDAYHQTTLSGLQGIGTNIDALTAVIAGQNGVIEQQGRAISQLQLRVSNIANGY